MVSSLISQFPVLNQVRSPKVLLRPRRFKDTGFVPLVVNSLQGRRPIQCYFRRWSSIECNVSGRNQQDLRLNRDGEFHQEPFWVTLMKESFWALRSLLVFLVEQPNQLRYIEWPSFHSTLKTATLTLVLVALLIVALSSIDSALCYLLALLLRRTA